MSASFTRRDGAQLHHGTSPILDPAAPSLTVTTARQTFRRELPAHPARSRGFSAVQLGGALAVSLAISAVLMARAGLTIDPWSRSNIPFYLAAMTAVVLRAGAVQRRLPYGRALADFAGHCAMFMVVTLLGAVTSYPISGLTHGYADPALQRIDAALHFDWLAWYRLVAAHRSLQMLGVAAYESIYVTPAVMLAWFAMTGQRGEVHRFLAAFWISVTATLAIFALMPAVGPLSFLWHGAYPYMPASELWQPDLIPALRARTVHIVDLGQLRGLVSAPSFHAASATLFIATAWRVPPLRWPLLWVNVAMLLATPVEGTHYLIDMIVGAIVALASLPCADAVLAWASHERTPSPAR